MVNGGKYVGATMNMNPVDALFTDAITPANDFSYNTMLDQNTVMNPPALPSLDPVPTVTPEPATPVMNPPALPVVVTNAGDGTQVINVPAGPNLLLLGGVAFALYLLFKRN